MSFSMVGAGDAMLLDKFPEGYRIEEIRRFVTDADVGFVNLEMTLTRGGIFASTFCGGQWIQSEPENLPELERYGFNLYACANNHSMDFSYDGVLGQIKLLKERHLPYAGIGRDLKEASQPVYFTAKDSEGKIKKTAMISCTTTFIDAARAGDGNKFFVGRPGVNGLRHKEIYYVNEEEMKMLRQIAESTYLNGERDNARKIGSLPPEALETFNFGGIFFKQSDKQGKVTKCDERDMKRILASIREAKENADYVVVMAHSHQIKHGSYTEPDYFFEEFCRCCIDEGAVCVFGGGTHQLKPVEVYRGRPIFYSLGNFIFQEHRIKKLPADFWDKYDYPVEWTLEQGLSQRSRNGTIGLGTDKHNYLTVLPKVQLEGDKVTEIVLKPLELNFNNAVYKGLPREANKEDTQYIYDYLKGICREYNTSLFLKDGMIYVGV